MVKKIIRIACAVLGAFILFLAIKGATQINDSINALDEAVYLQSPVVLPENEGKQIIIAGEVKMTKAAYDDELGIALYTPVAERVYEVETSPKDGEDNWTRKEQKYFFGAADLGEFALDESVLKLLHKLDAYTDFDNADLEPYMTEETYDRFYISEDFRSRYFYNHCDLEKRGEMTIVGVQRGNSIVLTDPTVGVNDGILSLDRLRQENRGSGFVGVAFGIVIAVGLMVYGLGDFLFKKRRKSKAA